MLVFLIKNRTIDMLCALIVHQVLFKIRSSVTFKDKIAMYQSNLHLMWHHKYSPLIKEAEAKMRMNSNSRLDFKQIVGSSSKAFTRLKELKLQLVLQVSCIRELIQLH